MEEENKTIEIRLQDFWEIFKRCWWVMLAAVIVVGIGTYTYLHVTHVDQYRSTASIFVLRDAGENQTGTSAGVSTAAVSIANYLVNDVVEVICNSNDKILERTIADTGKKLTVSQLHRMISVGTTEETHVVYVAVTAKNPEDAQILTKALAHNIKDYFNEDLFDDKMLTVMNEGKVPASPCNPISKSKVLLIAAAAGVLVYALYVVLFMLDDKINGPDDVSKYLNLSLLGDIPNMDDTNKKRKNKYGSYYYYYSHEGSSGGESGRAE